MKSATPASAAHGAMRGTNGSAAKQNPTSQREPDRRHETRADLLRLFLEAAHVVADLGAQPSEAERHDRENDREGAGERLGDGAEGVEERALHCWSLRAADLAVHRVPPRGRVA